MKRLKYKDQLLFNNNNQVEHYQKLYGSLNQKQQGKDSLNNDKLFSIRNLSEKKQMIATTENDCDTIIRRLNEHSYIVSFDNLQQESEFHSGKSTLTDIQTDLARDKENLLTSQGYIHIKEYAFDGYECRCHQQNDLINDKEIDNEKHSLNYTMKF